MTALDDDFRPVDLFEGLVLPEEYCPVSIGARVIGDRWILLIVRELLTGSTRFNDIHRGLPGISRTLLSTRLGFLTRQGIVNRVPTVPAGSGHHEYVLTSAGLGLRSVIEAIGTWTVDWKLPRPAETQANVPLLLWRLHQNIDRSALPSGRISMEFRFPGSDPSGGWIKIDSKGSDACLGAPEHDVDLIVTTSPHILNDLSFGYRTCANVKAAGEIRFEGPPSLERGFTSWFRTSPFADQIASQRGSS